MSAKIIALSGGIGSGKDTAGAYLVEKYGYQKVSFSSALKDITARLFGWDREMLEGVTPEARAKREEVDEWWSEQLMEDHSPRSMLQYLGTDIMRNQLHQDIWMLIVKRTILSAPEDAKFVVTDARFFNETIMLQSMGAQCMGIYRNLPPWLGDLYKFVDDQLLRLHYGGLMNVDLSDKANSEDVQRLATTFFNNRNIKAHQSEWEPLLFNKYAGLIDNTGTPLALYKQLDAIA